MRIFRTLDDVIAAVGEELGTSDWLEIDQARVDAFADATGDHQWIHVNAERAKEGPFGGTIAHGYLTLALVPFLGRQVFRIETPGATLNYGANSVRFPAPVPTGSRIRSRVTLTEASEAAAGTQLVFRHVIEVDGGDKPACVAETVVLLVG